MSTFKLVCRYFFIATFSLLLLSGLSLRVLAYIETAKDYLDDAYYYDEEESDYNSAIVACNNALNLESNFAEAYEERGWCYYAQGNYAPAIADETTAINLKLHDVKDRASAYGIRGASFIFFYGDMDKDSAMKDETKAIELDPKYAFPYAIRGFVYANYLGDQSAAISEETKAIQLEPKYALAYAFRGYAYYKEKYYSKAIADCNKAIEIDPDEFRAYQNRGYIYGNQCDYPHEIADETRAIELSPNAGNSYVARGWAYASIGKYDDAWTDVHKAQSLGSVIPQDMLDSLSAHPESGGAQSNPGSGSSSQQQQKW